MLCYRQCVCQCDARHFLGQCDRRNDIDKRRSNTFKSPTGFRRLLSEVTSQNLWSRYDRYAVGITRHIVWSYKAKICGDVIHIKLNQLVYANVHTIISFSNKACLSDATVTNIYGSFTHKMAAKTSWHRYGTKWRHCHPMYFSANKNS